MVRVRTATAIVAFTLAGACTLSTEGLAPDTGSSSTGGTSGTTSTTTTGATTTGATPGAGGGGGTTTSTATTSTTTTGATGGGGGGTETDCLNGADDDADGDIDCADVDCTAGYTCVPAADDAVAYLARVAAADPCAQGSAEHDLMACSGCSCNAAGGDCTVSFSTWSSAGCGGAPLGTVSNICLDNPDGNRWLMGTATHQGNASCTPASAQVPATHDDLCATPQPGGCASAAEVCVPKQGTAACVLMAAGAGGCPAAYPVASGRVFDEDGSGTCDCSCAVGATSCPNAVISVSHNQNNCTGNVDSFAADGVTCHDAGNTHSIAGYNVAGDVACDGSSAPAPSATAYVLCCE